MESQSPPGGSFSSFPIPPPLPFIQSVPNPSSSSSSSSISSSSLGFAGFGFVVFLLARSHSRFKPLSTAIKLADGAIHGLKALHLLRSPSPHSILFASKAFVKGYKISKRLYPPAAAAAPRIPPLAAKRLEACMGVINLVRYANYPFVGDGVLGFGVLNGGYKLSKNFAKVLEGFIGLQIDSALRKGIDAWGLVVKAIFVGRELGHWIAAELSAKNRLECHLVVGAGSRYAVCSSCQRLSYNHSCAYVNYFPVKKPPLREEPVIREIMSLQLYQVLSLAIPLHEILSMRIM